MAHIMQINHGIIYRVQDIEARAAIQAGSTSWSCNGRLSAWKQNSTAFPRRANARANWCGRWKSGRIPGEIGKEDHQPVAPRLCRADRRDLPLQQRHLCAGQPATPPGIAQHHRAGKNSSQELLEQMRFFLQFAFGDHFAS